VRLLRVFLGVALAGCLSHATILKKLTMDEMVSQSSAVVHGRIVASRVEWNGSHSAIVTVYTVQANRYLLGSLGSSFELVEPGGIIGNLVMSVTGAPHFALNEEVILFVWTDKVHGKHQAIGFEQGVYRLRQRRDLTEFLSKVNAAVVRRPR
jgi:hypothetical protein